MKKKISKLRVTFCYPNSLEGTRDVLISKIISRIEEDVTVGFAGFLKKIHLRDFLENKYPQNIPSRKTKSTPIQRQEIKTVLQKTAIICDSALGNKKSIQVFIFPWLGSTFDKDFKGVSGFTPYRGVIYLFLSPQKFDLMSLKETFCHEYNHAVFFYKQKSVQTLLESMVFEGLADNFREEILGGESSPWSISLSEKESRSLFKKLRTKLSSVSFKLYNEVLFGSEKYKKWSGYAIGYHIVKLFRMKNPTLKWDDVLSMQTKEIVLGSGFLKKLRGTAK